MIHRDLEGRGGSRHYSRWPDPWRREDDWGPITAAVVFFIILAGLIVHGSGGRALVRRLCGAARASRHSTSASVPAVKFFWIASSEHRSGLEFSWAAKPKTDTFGHEPALLARTCSPANLVGFPKFVGTPRCSDARRCHPCVWRNQGALAAMA